MSYDVRLVLCTDEHHASYSAWAANYTSNVAPMWRKAGVDLKQLNGLRALQARELLIPAIQAMLDDPASYKAMEPPNGWGDYPGALMFLVNLRDACEAYASATLAVSS